MQSSGVQTYVQRTLRAMGGLAHKLMLAIVALLCSSGAEQQIASSKQQNFHAFVRSTFVPASRKSGVQRKNCKQDVGRAPEEKMCLDLSGFEPLTSRLSYVRSNQLSYRSIFSSMRLCRGKIS